MLANGVDISSRCEDEIYILGIGRVDLVLTFFLKENNIFILTCGPNQIYIFLLLLYIPLKLYDDEKNFQHIYKNTYFASSNKKNMITVLFSRFLFWYANYAEIGKYLECCFAFE